MKAVIDTSWHPLAAGQAPFWATAWGHDRWGPWVEFSVREASQRMRWIPPGRFLMGSPPNEPGRWDDEGPPHEVLITRGFWLFETPCTQALWQAVMESNPSLFLDPNRPVESVSWSDCQQFLTNVNALVRGLKLSLPTEAQWEYACRATTTTATYAGEIKIVGTKNAPVLDPIAWYGGNSGVGFDFEIFSDSTGWEEKQYSHQRAGTRVVGSKLPNRWGLNDMLGNVWEWCHDWHGEYSGQLERDPVGPESGLRRVVRGGGWNSVARDVRSANRYWSDPGGRGDVLGFRCARVQE